MIESTKQASTGETRRIASYIAGARYEDLPLEVVSEAKKHILDTLGAMVMGVELDVGKVIVEFARQESGKEESTIVGSNFKTSCITACLTNGTLAHADEIDDVHHGSVVHGGCAAVPPGLAVSEREKADGRALINAVVLGYDIACRVCIALNPILLMKNNHSLVTIPLCFGAVATASSLIGLSEDQAFSALGLAAQQASGIYASFHEPRHMAKAFESGVAARDGVTAALLAELGFQGPPDIFEGPHNIFDAFSGEYNFPELTKDLGTYHHVVDTPIKKYPVGAPIQAPLEGLFRIMRDQKLQSGDIQDITITMAERFAWVVGNRPIQDISLEYLVAAGACYGKIGSEEAHSESKWKDPKIQDLKKRVRVVGDPSSEKLGPATVELITRDGKRHSITVEQIPMTQAEVEEKFLTWASPVLGSERAYKVIDKVGSLEELTDISELADLLRV